MGQLRLSITPLTLTSVALILAVCVVNSHAGFVDAVCKNAVNTAVSSREGQARIDAIYEEFGALSAGEMSSKFESSESQNAIRKVFQKHLSGKVKLSVDEGIKFAEDLAVRMNSLNRSAKLPFPERLSPGAEERVRNLVIRKAAQDGNLETFERLEILRAVSGEGNVPGIAKRVLAYYPVAVGIGIEAAISYFKLPIPPGSIVFGSVSRYAYDFLKQMTHRSLPPALVAEYRKFGDFEQAWKSFENEFPDEAAAILRTAKWEQALRLGAAITATAIITYIVEDLYSKGRETHSVGRVLTVPRREIVDGNLTDIKYDKRRRDIYEGWLLGMKDSGFPLDSTSAADRQVMEARWKQIQARPDASFQIIR